MYLVYGGRSHGIGVRVRGVYGRCTEFRRKHLRCRVRPFGTINARIQRIQTRKQIDKHP